MCTDKGSKIDELIKLLGDIKNSLDKVKPPKPILTRGDIVRDIRDGKYYVVQATTGAAAQVYGKNAYIAFDFFVKVGHADV